MNIILTNDDSYKAKGLQVLAKIFSKLGNLTVVAPKFPQSGMSMAVNLGGKPIAVKHLGIREENQDWWYLDGTPSSCVKYAIDNVLVGQKADLVVSGINHGSNAATAALYSGTLGAAMEGAVNGLLAIGVSLDSFSADADFSAVEELLPRIIEQLLEYNGFQFGDFVNINFPNLRSEEIKGVKVCTSGSVHWEKEYQDLYKYLADKGLELSAEASAYIANADSDEQFYLMVGDMVDNGTNDDSSDHIALAQGYITVTLHNINNSVSKKDLTLQL